MNIIELNGYWIIEEMQPYNPEQTGEYLDRKNKITDYVDNFVDEFIGERRFEEGMAIVSGDSYNELKKVLTPAYENIIDHRDKTHYIRYLRSVKIF